jgi:hypothetical protein
MVKPVLWNFKLIKKEVRGLVLKKSPNQLSEEDLELKINQYVFYKFPSDVNPKELNGWYEFTTSASTSEYTIDQDLVFSFKGSVYIADTDIVGDSGNVWDEPDLFALTFPPKTTITEAEPTDFLIYEGLITAMQIPDDTYYIKMPCIIRPDTLANDSDIPSANGREYEEWGSVYAHGAAVEILEKSGDDNRLNQVRSWLKGEINKLKKKVAFQNAKRVTMHRF